MLGISGGESSYPIGLKFFGGTVGPNVMADDNPDDYRTSGSWATTPWNSGFWPYSLATLTTVLHYRADCENIRHMWRTYDHVCAAYMNNICHIWFAYDHIKKIAKLWNLSYMVIYGIWGACMWYMAKRWNWTYMINIIALYVRYMQSYKEHIRNIICVLYVTYIVIYIELILVLHLAYRPNVYVPYYMCYIYVTYMLTYVHIYARYVQ